MMSSQSIVLYLLISLICLNSVSSAQKRHFCGPFLPMGLQIVCKGKYNSPFREEKIRSRGQPKRSSRSIIKHLVRLQRQVVDECCRQPCDFDTLRQYCADF